MAEVDPELKTDARWQLIERITASPSFQKSARIRDLLRYMAERTLHGQTQDLTEHRIGSAVFGKPPDYSVVDDSSVRVHVRQLRLKLHEYFDGEGREEACVVEIPKGAYTTPFRSVGQRTTPPVPAPAGELKTWLRWLPWALAVLFLVTTVTAWFYHPSVTTPLPPPWPLAALFTPPNRPVQVVVADVNYGMTRLVDEQPVTLELRAHRSGQRSHPARIATGGDRGGRTVPGRYQQPAEAPGGPRLLRHAYPARLLRSPHPNSGSRGSSKCHFYRRYARNSLLTTISPRASEFQQ